MVAPRARAAHGRGFGALGELYDSVRPRYPRRALDFTGIDWPDVRVCDLGAGTGILSRGLLERGAEVVAVDPDESALARNPAPGVPGTAEATGLADDSVDVVAVGQAWHWFDEAAAGAEIARILSPGGRLLILINQLDVRCDWVLRLSRIMHAGDVYRPAYRPAPGSGLALDAHELVEFATPMDLERVIDLARTRSYWLRSSPAVRNRVEANLREYLSTEHPVSGEFDLPYMCLAYLLGTPAAGRTA